MKRHVVNVTYNGEILTVKVSYKADTHFWLDEEYELISVRDERNGRWDVEELSEDEEFMDLVLDEVRKIYSEDDDEDLEEDEDGIL